MQAEFVEVSPGYLIAIRTIQAIQWKDDKLIIAYDKGGSSAKIEVKNVRGAADYLFEQLRRLSLTYETGPELDTGEEEY